MFSAPQLPKDAKIAYKGHGITIRNREQKMFDESYNTFECFQRRDFINLIPITPEGKIIIVEEEQPWLENFFGFIGGNIEVGDSIEKTVHKETMEESGIQIHSMKRLYSMPHYAAIGHSHCHVTRDFSYTHQTQRESGEKIQCKEVSFDEFIEYITGEKRRPIEFTYRAMKNYLIHGDKQGLKDVLFN